MAQLKLKNKVKTWQISFHTGSNVIQMNISEKEGQRLLKELTDKEIKQPTENKQKSYHEKYKDRQQKD